MRNIDMKFVLISLLAAAVALPALAQYPMPDNPLEVLKSADASLKEKQDACRTLVWNPDKAAIPILEELLTDAELSHMARRALEPMPYPEVDAVLRDALSKTQGELRVGVINSLRFRKDEEAVPMLIPLLSSDEQWVPLAAAKALGEIATPEAVDALMKVELTSENTGTYCDGLLSAAEALEQQGKNGQAIAVYDKLHVLEDAPRHIRTAGLRGAVLLRGDEGLPILLEAVRSKEDPVFAAALRIIREFGESERVTSALADAFSGLTPERKALLCHALGQRGDPVSGPALLVEAGEGPAPVRVAAIEALARMGYEPALEPMARMAWSAEGEVAQAARDAVSYFPSRKRQGVLMAMLDNEAVDARRTATELIAQGGLTAPATVLMKTAQSDSDESVRVAALEALEACAEMDQMQPLLNQLLKGTEGERQAAEAALSALFAREKRASNASKDITIKRAVYGDLPDGKKKDVTKKVNQMVQDGALAIAASNATFGDPAPGTVKGLQVTYERHGETHTVTAGENERVHLASAVTPPEVVDALQGTLEEAQGEAKLAAVRLLGAAGGPEALEAVKDLAGQAQGDVKQTALATLCQWQTADALPLVMDLAKTAGETKVKVLALRGAVRLLKQADLNPSEQVQRCRALMENAPGPEEKKLVLSALAQTHTADAFSLALSQFTDEAVKAEAVQSAIAVATGLGRQAREDKSFFNGTDLTGWTSAGGYWSVEEGAIVGHSAEPIPSHDFLWSAVEVGDFYLSVDVKLVPNSANSGIQFRSKKADDEGHATGYQADIGANVWGRLYHERGRGKLYWNGRAEEAVKPEQWNHCEILAVGPAIWTAINGKLGVSFLDTEAKDEASGKIAFQIHTGPPQTVRFRVKKLVHNPGIELAGLGAAELVGELKTPGQE